MYTELLEHIPAKSRDRVEKWLVSYKLLINCSEYSSYYNSYNNFKFFGVVLEKTFRKCLLCSIRPSIGCHVYVMFSNTGLSFICFDCISKHGYHYSQKVVEAVINYPCDDPDKPCYERHLAYKLRESLV